MHPDQDWQQTPPATWAPPPAPRTTVGGGTAFLVFLVLLVSLANLGMTFYLFRVVYALAHPFG